MLEQPSDSGSLTGLIKSFLCLRAPLPQVPHMRAVALSRHLRRLLSGGTTATWLAAARVLIARGAFGWFCSCRCRVVVASQAGLVLLACSPVGMGAEQPAC